MPRENFIQSLQKLTPAAKALNEFARGLRNVATIFVVQKRYQTLLCLRQKR